MNISHFLMCIFVRQLYWSVPRVNYVELLKTGLINVHLFQKFHFQLYLNKINEGAGTHVKKIFFFLRNTEIFLLSFWFERYLQRQLNLGNMSLT